MFKTHKPVKKYNKPKSNKQQLRGNKAQTVNYDEFTYEGYTGKIKGMK